MTDVTGGQGLGKKHKLEQRRKEASVLSSSRLRFGV